MQSHQDSPKFDPYWRALNDYQVEEAKARQRQQQFANQRLKLSYNEELQRQIEQRRRRKQEQEEYQKRRDAEMIEKSVTAQKRIYEMEQQRLRELNQASMKIERDNQLFEAEKRNREEWIKGQEKNFIDASLKSKEEELRREREFEEYKKLRLRKELVESIEVKQLMKRRQRMSEKEYEAQMLRQQQQISERIDQDRNQFLAELKAKAAQVDPYHVQGVYMNQVQREIMQKRKEEVQTYREMVEGERIIRQNEEQERMKRLVKDIRYRKELRDQMETKEQYDKIIQQKEKQAELGQLSMKLSIERDAEMRKKAQEAAKRQEYLKYLQKQSQEVRGIRGQVYQMMPLEYKLNRPLLESQTIEIQKPPGIIPGSYNVIDHERKKQWSILEKNITTRSRENRTISYDGAADSSYFSQNGKRILN